MTENPRRVSPGEAALEDEPEGVVAMLFASAQRDQLPICAHRSSRVKTRESGIPSP